MLSRKAKFIAVNEKDVQTYEKIFSTKDVVFLPVFLPFKKVNSKEGKGTYCLYHGNLSVVENEKVVFWLLEKVFNDINIELVIAGKNPGTALKNRIAENQNVTLVENPPEEKMSALLQEAQLHILPSFNTTGIKIKLLNALFNGRFIITNAASLDGSGLASLCIIAETPADYKSTIQQKFEIAFTKEEIDKRVEILETMYDNQKNAEQLLTWL